MSFLRTPGVREAPNVATIADMPRPREDLERDIVRALRGIRGLDPVSDRERRTMLIRECAAMLVELREHFLTDDGRPDWTGRTWPYRAAVRELYSRAGIPPAEATSLQAAVRYHAGNFLRDLLTATELEEYGIGPETPRDRTRASHSARNALVHALRGEGSGEDIARALAMVVAMLERLSAERVAELRGKERRRVVALLRRVAERTERLLAE